jgi:hypothetical protein
VFCGGRGKSGGLVEKGNAPTTKKFSYYKILTKKIVREKKMKTREDKRMVKLFFFQMCTFWKYILKKSARSLLGAQSLLLVHIRLTRSERPKGFINRFFSSSEIKP